MTILFLTDIHGDLTYLDRAAPWISGADLILIGGDITHFGGPEEAKAVLEPIREINSEVYGVCGNCDKPEIRDWMIHHGFSLEDGPIHYNGLNLYGIGGSLPCPGRTPNEYDEEGLTTRVSHLTDNASDSPGQEIWVCHQPPYKTKVDRVIRLRPVGSRALRQFIENRQPLALFSGHIHESSGIDHLGKTVLANPGPFKNGRFSLCQISFSEGDWAISVQQVDCKRDPLP